MKIKRATNLVLLLLFVSITITNGLGSKFYKKNFELNKNRRANLQFFGLSEQGSPSKAKVDGKSTISPSVYLQRSSKISLEASQTSAESESTTTAATSEATNDASGGTTEASAAVTAGESSTEAATTEVTATATSAEETAATAEETAATAEAASEATGLENTSEATAGAVTEATAAATTETAAEANTAAATASTAPASAAPDTTGGAVENTITPAHTTKIVAKETFNQVIEHPVPADNLTEAVNAQIAELELEVEEQMQEFQAALYKINQTYSLANPVWMKDEEKFADYVNRTTEETSELIYEEAEYVIGEIESVELHAQEEYIEIDQDMLTDLNQKLTTQEKVVQHQLDEEVENLEELEGEIIDAKIQMLPPLSYCSVYPTCDLCTQSDKCVYCPFEKKCVDGDALGPLTTVCRIFNYKVCTGIECGVFTSCHACTSDSSCGWCAYTSFGVKACLERSESYSGCPADDWVHAGGVQSDCSVLSADDQAVNVTTLQAIEGRETNNLANMNGTDLAVDNIYYGEQGILQALVDQAEETKHWITELQAEITEIEDEKKDLETYRGNVSSLFESSAKINSKLNLRKYQGETTD